MYKKDLYSTVQYCKTCVAMKFVDDDDDEMKIIIITIHH